MIEIYDSEMDLSSLYISDTLLMARSLFCHLFNLTICSNPQTKATMKI